MTDDKELEGWRSEWQSLGGRQGFADDLARNVARDARRIRRGVATEIAGGVFAASISVWLISSAHGELVSTFTGAGVLVFCGVWTTRLLTLRQAGPSGEGLDGFIELTRRRMTDDLRWSRFTRRTTKVLAALLVPWSAWAFVTRHAMYRAEPWRGLVGFGGVAIILAGLYVWQRRKHRKLETERDRFESVVAERTLA